MASDQWMDGLTDGRMIGWIDVKRGGWMNGWETVLSSRFEFLQPAAAAASCGGSVCVCVWGDTD